MKMQQSSKLLEKKFGQIYIPQICSQLAKNVIVGIDAIIASRAIGLSALAALSLTVPILTIDEALHCIIGGGVSTKIAHYVGAQKRETANRFMGAVLAAVVLAYVIVFLPVIIFMDKWLLLITADAEVCLQAKQYLIPTIIAMPFFEICLCLEKAYQIDGKAKLFAARSVIASSLNIVFDLLFVVVLNKGIIGLSISSIIATFLGYLVVLQHGFSRQCSIHPDFSVLLKPRECISYLRESAVIGGTSAIEEFLSIFISIVICKLLSQCGGVAALALWSIFSFLIDLLEAAARGLGTSVTLLCGTLFGEKDYDGIRLIAKRALRRIVVIGLIFSGFVCVFARHISLLYGISSDLLSDSTLILRISCSAFFFMALIRFYENYLLTIDRLKTAYLLDILENVFIFAMLFAGGFLGLPFIFLGYNLAYVLLLAWLLIAMKRFGDNWFLSHDVPGRFASFSIDLVPEQFVEVSHQINNALLADGYDENSANQIALLVEDSCNYILLKNNSATVRADIRLCLHEDGMRISLTDDGIPYNASSDMTFDDSPDRLAFLVINNISKGVEYDRILELNYLRMVYLH